MNHVPQAPENNISVFSNFSKIRGDIRKSSCTTGINDTGVVYTGDKFAAGVVSWIPVVHFDLSISLRIFEKIRNDPNVIFRGLWEDDS
jgi:hypothetical protein